MPKIILTADRALFTDFSGNGALGFGLCLPYRLVPSFVEYRILAPPIPANKDGRARYVPYALAKIEAVLLDAGFSRDDVVITPPEYLERVVDKDTQIVGIHVVDPQGLAPVSWTLRILTGGGATCTQYEFEKLMAKIKELKSRYRFKVIVGGPGVWQLRGLEDKFGIDVLFDGEAEITFPLIVSRILRGEEVPRYVTGDIAPIEKIPPIITPSRNGIVQISRGCPRKCQFCSPTMFHYRSIPLETVLKEVEVNLKGGSRYIDFATEDVLLYGARGLQFNHDAVVKLFTSTLEVTKKYGVERVGFTHVTLSTALAMKDTVKFITEINGYSEQEPHFPQVGFESGSPRIVDMYFRGKPYPWSPKDWPEIVVEGSKLLNDNYWYPCLTYIVGFPNETADDAVKTIEVIDRLRDEDFKGWTFPLLLIPIGGTIIEKKAQFHILKNLTKEAIDAIVAGWKLSIRFSRIIYRKLLSSIKNPMIYKFIDIVAEKTFDTMEKWITALEKNPEIIENSFSKVNIRTIPSLISTLIKSKFKEH